jgi:purine-binding chemotaxis protein CheW
MIDSFASTAVAAGSDKFHCVTFILGGDLFGIEIRFIREIIEFEGITRVPMMPSFVRGIINLRGAVVPVIDLSVRFGREPTEVGLSTCVAILSLPGDDGRYSEVGVLLDAVCEVLEIPNKAIDPTPSFGANIQGDFIQGIATINTKFAILLDVHRAMSVADLSAMAEMVNQKQFADDVETA